MPKKMLNLDLNKAFDLSASTASSKRKGIVIGIIVSILLFTSMTIFLLASPSKNVENHDSPTVSEKNLEPPKPKRSPVSLPNGTDVMPPDKNKGLGTLTIVNGKNHDAVVQLIDENKPETVYRCVYVKRDDKVTITQIAPGAYQLKFTTGDDWDKETLKFLEYAEYHQFDDSLIFREVSTQTSTEYSRYEVTLHKVAQGNARTAPIDERAFKKVSPQ